MKAAALKDFSPYVAKVKAQSGDVNRVYQRLKTMQQLKTIENNLITSIFKVILISNKTRYTVSGFIEIRLLTSE
jgi:hypothetical protein